MSLTVFENMLGSDEIKPFGFSLTKRVEFSLYGVWLVSVLGYAGCLFLVVLSWW